MKLFVLRPTTPETCSERLMPIEITMPRLSDTMEKGTIVKWHVAAGDTITSGDVLADVETDKATMEMQSYDDGTMATIMIGEGQPVEIGTVVAVMTEEDESLDDVATPVLLLRLLPPTVLQQHLLTVIPSRNPQRPRWLSPRHRL